MPRRRIPPTSSIALAAARQPGAVRCCPPGRRLFAWTRWATLQRMAAITWQHRRPPRARALHGG
eukprot:8900027-Pyramimonas_sp.AAC.1